MSDQYFAIIANTAIPVLRISSEEMDKLSADLIWAAGGPISAIPVYFSDDGRIWPWPCNYVTITKAVKTEDGRIISGGPLK